MHRHEALPSTEPTTDTSALADEVVGDGSVPDGPAAPAGPPEFDVEPYFGKRIAPEPSVMAPILDRANKQFAAEANAKRASVIRLLERVHAREAGKACPD